MGKNSIRMMLAVLSFLVAAQWSRPALADVTIKGTVGEIGAIVYSSNYAVYRFKLTDVTQTATCTNASGFAATAGPAYAYFPSSDIPFKEWYAMLLVSKKGAPISCTMVNSTTDCHITSCTLP